MSDHWVYRLASKLPALRLHLSYVFRNGRQSVCHVQSQRFDLNHQSEAVRLQFCLLSEPDFSLLFSMLYFVWKLYRSVDYILPHMSPERSTGSHKSVCVSVLSRVLLSLSVRLLKLSDTVHRVLESNAVHCVQRRER